MGENVKVVFEKTAFGEILFSGKVADYVTLKAEGVKAYCGDGYEIGARPGKRRYRASVITSNGDAMRDNAKNNTLLKGLLNAR